MPFYEYRCRDCGEIFEVLKRIGAGEEGVGCPLCGVENSERLMSLSAVPRGSTLGDRTPGGCAPRGGFS